MMKMDEPAVTCMQDPPLLIPQLVPHFLSYMESGLALYGNPKLLTVACSMHFFMPCRYLIK
jgi:hypothetical protein